MLANAVMVITLPYINTTNQHTVNVKLIQCYMSSHLKKEKNSEIIKSREGIAIFNSIMKEDLTWKVTVKHKLDGDEVVIYADILGKTCPSRRHKQCKGLEVGAGLICSRKIKEVIVARD